MTAVGFFSGLLRDSRPILDSGSEEENRRAKARPLQGEVEI